MALEVGMDGRIVRTYLRQLDIIDPRNIPPVAVIGCGASGSGVGQALAKMGCPIIHLWDGDMVEPHNIPNQYFPNSSVGTYKAEALRREMLDKTPSDILPSVIAHNRFFGSEDRARCPVVFMLVDGFDNRKIVFRALLDDPDVQYIIDTRMGAEYLEVWTVDKSSEVDIERYRESLRHRGRPLPCTGRSVIYNVLSIAGLAVSIFKHIIKGEPYPKRITLDLKNYTPPLVIWEWE